MQLAVLDADGYAVCPDCGTRVKCGSAGLANLEKRHCIELAMPAKMLKKSAKRNRIRRIQAYSITLKGPKRLRCPHFG